MQRPLYFCALVLVVGMCSTAAFVGRAQDQVKPTPAGESSSLRGKASFTKDVLPFLTKHCFHCHGNGKKSGGITLDKFKDDESVPKNRAVWEHVIHMVRTGEMPAKGRPRPTAEEIEKALGAIDTLMTSIDCSKERNAGRVTLRRLNKTEYNNTIRDLIGIDFKPAADFPPDDTGYGFDNIGDVLSVSPLLLEKYLAAAEAIVNEAIVVADPPKPARERLGGLRATFRAGEVPEKGGPPFLHSLGDISAQTEVQEGDYVIRADVSALLVGDEPVKAVIRVNRTDIKEFEIKSATTIEAKTRLKAGGTRVAVGFLNPFTDETIEDTKKQKRLLYVRNISIDGPHDAPPPTVPETHKRLMGHEAGLTPRDAAKEIVGRFATRAFRRPVPPEEVE
ncbi:MAG: DUF1587 domain-containing protein, partial [Gemmataceae bacterium]|nr:DUF1587 domain-containing protein [Gemmataceae bacterium]